MKITVIGLGYVGTTAAACLADSGHDVAAVDVDNERVANLRSGWLSFHEPGLETLAQRGVSGGRLRFSHISDFDESLGDLALVGTGTPPTATGAADLNQVRSALAWIRERASGDTTVVMKSTVPPGAGRSLVANELADTGVSYVSNPEFLREGHAIEDWEHPHRIVIGAVTGDTRSVEAVKAMHAGIDAPYLVTDITSAEMIKYASNALLATRISFINEIATLCQRVGASIDAVSQGIAMDSRTGDRVHAGVGYGGSCFPKDVRALDHLALVSGIPMDLLHAVITVNNRQRLLPLFALRERFNGSLSGLRIAVLGLAFKPGTDDVRESAALGLIQSLSHDGAKVAAYDPLANDTARPHLPKSVELVDHPIEATQGSQAAVVITEWEEIRKADWEAIGRGMRSPRFIFDGRNALDQARLRQLGFEYVGVGRPLDATDADGHRGV